MAESSLRKIANRAVEKVHQAEHRLHRYRPAVGLVGFALLCALSIPAVNSALAEIPHPPRTTQDTAETMPSVQPAAGIPDASLPLMAGAVPLGQGALAYPPEYRGFFKNEPMISVDPAQPNAVVAVSNYADRSLAGKPDLRDSDPTVYTSTDGGKTFAAPRTVPGFLHNNLVEGDPVVVQRAGLTVFSFLSYSPDSNAPGGMYVAVSPDHGQSWNVHMLENNSDSATGVDKPWTAMSANGKIASAWGTGVSSTQWQLRYRQSVDGGTTWSQTAVIPSTRQYNVGVYPEFDRQNKLMAAFYSFDNNNSDVVFWREDGTKQTIATVPGWAYQRGMMPHVMETADGRLNCVWGNGQAIYLSASGDRGATWNTQTLGPLEANVSMTLPTSALVNGGQNIAVGGYYFNSATQSLLPVVTVPGLSQGWYPVGQPLNTAGYNYMGDWPTFRSFGGDYEGMIEQREGLGLFAYAMPDLGVTSTPPAYAKNITGNIYVAPVVTRPQPDLPPQITVFRPPAGDTKSVAVPVFNEAVVAGAFTFNATNPDATCPPPPQATSSPIISARTTGTVLFSVQFDAAENKRICSYPVTVNGVPVTTISAFEGQPANVYMPQIAR